MSRIPFSNRNLNPHPIMTMKSETTTACIDVCNRLLRGELSAVETYEQTLRKFEGDPAVVRLGDIRAEHQRAAGLLRDNIVRMGGKPSEDSGVWGAMAQVVQGTAKLFGETSALANLRQGEEHGIKDYTDALADDDVMPDCKALIRDELLPAAQRHLDTLDGLASAR